MPNGGYTKSSDPFERKACLQFLKKVPLDLSDDFSTVEYFTLYRRAAFLTGGLTIPDKAAGKMIL